MKLYATVTSERASKGQGGNKYLIIEIKAERFDGIPTRANQYRLSLSADPTSNRLYVELHDYSNGETTVLNGKKQKGECKHLRRTRTGDPKTEYWGYKCDDCGKFA